MGDQWHKIAALLVRRLAEVEGRAAADAAVVITVADLDAAMHGPRLNLTVRIIDERGILLDLVDDATAARLARQEGGLPS